MDAVFNVLLFVHLMGLVLGLGGGIANSQIGPAIGAGSPETRPTLWKLQHAMSNISKVGLALLLVTGIAMTVMRYRELAATSPLFWLKMALVVALIGSIAVTVRAASKVEKGEFAAAGVMKTAGMLNGIIATLTVLVAVFIFG